MPRKRKIHRHRRWTPLQLLQLQCRLLGGSQSAFASDEERRQCWLENRERLFAAVAEHHPDWRPEGWWLYESPEPRDHNLVEPEQLRRMGVLRPDKSADVVIPIRRR